MAYFYNSNYSENIDNYQYYDHCYYNNHDSNHEPSYVNQNSSTECYENAYQHAPTPSLVGYYYSSYDQPEFLASKNANFQENGECYYYDPVSTGFVVSYNSTTAEGADVVEEKGPKTLSLGDVNVGSVPPPGVKQGSEVIHEEEPSDFEDDDEFDDDEFDEDDDEFDEDDEEYDDDYDEEEELEEGKQDGIGKEPSNLGPIVPLVGALPTKEAQNLEGEVKKKDDGIGGEVIQEKKALDLEVNDAGKGKDKGEGDLDESETKNQNIGEVIQEKKALDLEINKGEGKGEGNLGAPKPKDDSTSEVIQGKKALDLEVSGEGKGKGEGKGDLGEPMPKNESIGEVIQQEKALEKVDEDEFEDEDEYEDEDEDDFEESEGEGEGEGEGEVEVESKGKADLGDQGRKQEDYGNQVRRQIPPGYGIEAFDICEGLFGGYFPCLWRRNQRIYNHQRDANEIITTSDYDYCWKETADYLFGNPNPYGGTMPEKGSYGDPIYSYQRHYPQQTITEQVEPYGGNSSYLYNSRYSDGHNGRY